MSYVIEELDLEKFDEYDLIKLPELTEDEKLIIDPIVPPTSGLRIQLFDQVGNLEKFTLPSTKQFLFFRVAKAIGVKYREMFNEESPKILIVSDSRPSSNYLVKMCSRIFAYDGFEICFQQNGNGNSLMSSPYASASVVLYDDINITLMITASHNPLDWNGLKFYIQYPIPISGDLMKQVSNIALSLKEIRLINDFSVNRIDAEQKNNQYIKNLLSKVIDIRALKNEKVVIWPYLGKAKGVVNLFKDLGADVTLIEETINPPNPIKVVKREKLIQTMESVNSKMALLLDADEDRLAFFLKEEGGYNLYIPNELYSAMHNLLAEKFNKSIINIRTIPSDYRGDHTSILNIVTGVGYKHLGLILYFLFGVSIDKSKVDTSILYIEDGADYKKISEPTPLREKIKQLIKEKNISLPHDFILVLWEESGGHTFNILTVDGDVNTGELNFKSEFPIIADKYPVPALVVLSELIARGYKISEAIDWTKKGINRTINASDREKITIMNNFERNIGTEIPLGKHEYKISSFSDNLGKVDIFQMKRDKATLYFRPSGTGPDVRFYIFGDVDTHEDEINEVMKIVKEKYS